MAVKTELVDMLRALVSGDFDAVDRHMEAAERDGGEWAATTGLLASAFWLAVERRFDEHTAVEEIASFVGEVRRQYGEAEVPSMLAEALIRAARGEEHLMQGIDLEEAVPVEMVLLYKLISDEAFAPEQQEAFVAEAVRIADQSLAG